MHNAPMQKIHFSHANGFPAQSYEYFFSQMKECQFDFINTMGHAGYKTMTNLSFLKDELLDYVEANNTEPVIGMGHSSGAAATLLAAAEKPELFEKIILIDPVTLGSKKRVAAELAKKLKLWERFSPAYKAKRRRFEFSSKQQAFDYYQTKALFKDFHASCFKDYIEHGLKPSDKGFELTFLPQVEADIFSHMPTKLPKDLSKIDGTIIYAKNSNIFGPSDINWWKRRHPHFKLICFDGYHLFPFEQPEKAANAIQSLI